MCTSCRSSRFALPAGHHSGNVDWSAGAVAVAGTPFGRTTSKPLGLPKRRMLAVEMVVVELVVVAWAAVGQCRILRSPRRALRMNTW